MRFDPRIVSVISVVVLSRIVGEYSLMFVCSVNKYKTDSTTISGALAELITDRAMPVIFHGHS